MLLLNSFAGFVFIGITRAIFARGILQYCRVLAMRVERRVGRKCGRRGTEERVLLPQLWRGVALC